MSTGAPSYYNRPLLKASVWTWEVPVYFFVGGAAGAASIIALLANRLGGDAALARDARWLALAGAVVAPLLLVSDLGRPARFLHMLRVFKLRSPMSVGAWTLVTFGGAAFAAVVCAAAPASWPWAIRAARVADTLAAATGAILATYTGVLIGATAIPVWSRHVRVLPIQFGISGLGAAVGLLELAGHRTWSMNLIGIGATLVETVLLVVLGRSRGPAAEPLHDLRKGAGARWVRAGGILAGPLPLALRLAAASNGAARVIAAGAMIAGSLFTRIGWIAVGRASAADPQVALSGP